VEDVALNPKAINVQGKTQGEIAAALQYNYPIFTDDFLFRVNPDNFEKLRSEYNYRREFYFES
jgi:erythronate-4-phosphate dehydrogenase